MPTPTEAELRKIVALALRKLLADDFQLIEVDANERSISHRLAIYVEDGLKVRNHTAWHVDCEYNRDGLHPKATDLFTERVDNGDEHACTVYPDIIVHRRGTKDNLLVIELKKSSSNIPPDKDRQKIESYCRAPLSYRYALFLKLRTDDRQVEPWTEEWRVAEDAGARMGDSDVPDS